VDIQINEINIGYAKCGQSDDGQRLVYTPVNLE